MSWFDDLSDLFDDGPDLSVIDPLTLPDDWMQMDQMPTDLIGALSPDDWASIIGAQPENGSFIGPDGTDVNGFTPTDYTDLDQFNAGLDSGGSGPGFWQSVGRMLTGSKNPTTAGALAGLLPLLAGIGGGVMNRNASNEATQQTIAGINKASDQATGLINGASQNFQPYIQSGQAALQKMATQQPSNLAGQFGPVAGQFGNLAGTFRPLGSGRALSSLARPY